MRCLGHVICGNSSVTEDWKSCVYKIWGSVFANIKPGVLQAPLPRRLALVDTLGKSVLAFHWSHWPWTQQQEARIDSLQRHIIGHMLRVRPLPGAAFDVFTHRKSILTGRLQTADGRWSAAWCGSLADWEAHCNRSSDWGGWAGSLLDFNGSRWLEGRRGPSEPPLSHLTRLSLRPSIKLRCSPRSPLLLCSRRPWSPSSLPIIRPSRTSGRPP